MLAFFVLGCSRACPRDAQNTRRRVPPALPGDQSSFEESMYSHHHAVNHRREQVQRGRVVKAPSTVCNIPKKELPARARGVDGKCQPGAAPLRLRVKFRLRLVVVELKDNGRYSCHHLSTRPSCCTHNPCGEALSISTTQDSCEVEGTSGIAPSVIGVRPIPRCAPSSDERQGAAQHANAWN